MSEEILEGGLGDGFPDEAFDPKQLEMGIEVEYEHTDEEEIAKEIAKDHLVEIDTYYTHLLKMEEDYEKGKLSAYKLLKSKIAYMGFMDTGWSDSDSFYPSNEYITAGKPKTPEDSYGDNEQKEINIPGKNVDVTLKEPELEVSEENKTFRDILRDSLRKSYATYSFLIERISEELIDMSDDTSIQYSSLFEWMYKHDYIRDNIETLNNIQENRKVNIVKTIESELLPIIEEVKNKIYSAFSLVYTIHTNVNEWFSYYFGGSFNNSLSFYADRVGIDVNELNDVLLAQSEGELREFIKENYVGNIPNYEREFQKYFDEFSYDEVLSVAKGMNITSVNFLSRIPELFKSTLYNAWYTNNEDRGLVEFISEMKDSLDKINSMDMSNFSQVEDVLKDVMDKKDVYKIEGVENIHFSDIPEEDKSKWEFEAKKLISYGVEKYKEEVMGV